MALADMAGFLELPGAPGQHSSAPWTSGLRALLQRKIILLKDYPVLPQPLPTCAGSTAHVAIGLRMMRTKACGPILTLSPQPDQEPGAVRARDDLAHFDADEAPGRAHRL